MVALSNAGLRGKCAAPKTRLMCIIPCIEITDESPGILDGWSGSNLASASYKSIF